MDDVLLQLREADPARYGTGYADDKVLAAVDAIVGDDSAGPESPSGRRSAVRRVAVAVVSVAAVSAVAIVADVVNWPWTRGAESSAYAVTKQADGSVEVRVRLDELQDAKGLQAQLRGAGVPAVVLVESPKNTCDEPPQNGTLAGAAATRPVLSWDGPRPTDVFVIRPDLLPTGSTVVIGLAFPGETDGYYVTWYVTDQKPPTCIPQSQGL